MGNVWDNIFREYESTHFMFNTLSLKIVQFMSVEKYDRVMQAIDDSAVLRRKREIWMPDN